VIDHAHVFGVGPLCDHALHAMAATADAVRYFVILEAVA